MSKKTDPQKFPPHLHQFIRLPQYFHTQKSFRNVILFSVDPATAANVTFVHVVTRYKSPLSFLSGRAASSTRPDRSGACLVFFFVFQSEAASRAGALRESAPVRKFPPMQRKPSYPTSTTSDRNGCGGQRRPACGHRLLPAPRPDVVRVSGSNRGPGRVEHSDELLEASG